MKNPIAENENIQIIIYTKKKKNICKFLQANSSTKRKIFSDQIIRNLYYYIKHLIRHFQCNRNMKLQKLYRNLLHIARY